MPEFIPFQALRPRQDKIAIISAKSTDYRSQELLVDALRNNPHSFHHVTKSHLNYSGAFQEPEKFLPFAGAFISELKQKGLLLKDTKPCFYLYEQVRGDGKKFKGLIGLAGVDDYNQNRIKKHEEIRPSRIKFLVELFKTTKVLGEPTLLCYGGINEINEPVDEVLYEFTSVDGKKHTISSISNPDTIAQIQQSLSQVHDFYIADGHHRSASIAEFHHLYPSSVNKHCLSLLMHEDSLEINSFHRLIKSVNTISLEKLLKKLSEEFTVSLSQNHVYAPKTKGQFGLYAHKQWYNLMYKGSLIEMDVEILEQVVVNKIYEIEDSRVDSQISFMPHTEGIDKLVDLIDSGTFDAAFTVGPCNFSEIRNTADRGEVLPPKSTYIEPKLRAGMIIQEF